MPDDDAPIRCHCGDTIRPTNWSLGPGWIHEHGSSQCRSFASPRDSDRERAYRRLRGYADRLGLPLPCPHHGPDCHVPSHHTLTPTERTAP